MNRILLLWLFCVVAVHSPVLAEDVVVVAATQKGAPPLEKKGTVEDYNGTELTLRGPNDRLTTIPAERVLEIRTSLTTAERAGDAARAQGKLAEALTAYRAAQTEERRAWAARKIQAKLVACYEWNDQPEAAAEEFLSIVRQDEQTPYFYVIPLPWRTGGSNAALLEKARGWMNAKANPAANLLGASWLLSGEERPKALNVLQSLTSDLDPRIATLAVAQIWRTKLVTATADDLARWQQHLARVPTSVQGGPLLLIGQLQQKLKLPEEATVAYLQVALAPQQRETLAAESFLQAAKLLEQQNRLPDAARLYRELQLTQPLAATIHNVSEKLTAIEKAGK